MTRQNFRELAELRAEDAATLLAGARWSAAYYVAGYAIECGLKACVMRRVGEEDGSMLFERSNFQSKFCLTHRLADLVEGAGLTSDLLAKATPGSQFEASWSVVSSGTERDRYSRHSRTAAQLLYDAVTDPHDGLLPWIKTHW